MPKKQEVSIDPSDGLICSVIKEHSEEKIKLISYYLEIFTVATNKSFPNRTMICLYSGSGRAKLDNTKEIIDTISLSAVKTKAETQKYIFVDSNSEKVEALKFRIKNTGRIDKSYFITGKAEESINEIKKNIPANSLCCTVIDPFNVGDFDFQIIKSLTEEIRTDIIVLVPTYMDANRNLKTYLKEESPQIDRFLGTNEWRRRWENISKMEPMKKFGDFFLNEFYMAMKNLNYIYDDNYSYAIKHREKKRDYIIYLFSATTSWALNFGKKHVQDRQIRFHF